MEFFVYFTATVCALIALGAMSFHQTLRAMEMQRQIKTLSERCDEYAAALLKLPDMGGVRELIFTDKERAAQAHMIAASVARMRNRGKPMAADFARHVPPELREELRSPRAIISNTIPPAMIAQELRQIRAALDDAATLPPGGNPATLHAAARSTPMPPPALPAMLAGAGIALGVANTDGGSVTTPGSFA